MSFSSVAKERMPRLLRPIASSSSRSALAVEVSPTMNGLASVTCIALRMRITSRRSVGSLVESMPNSGSTADRVHADDGRGDRLSTLRIGFAGQGFERGDDARLAGRGEIETGRVAGRRPMER